MGDMCIKRNVVSKHTSVITLLVCHMEGSVWIVIDAPMPTSVEDIGKSSKPTRSNNVVKGLTYLGYET